MPLFEPGDRNSIQLIFMALVLDGYLLKSGGMIAELDLRVDYLGIPSLKAYKSRTRSYGTFPLLTLVIVTLLTLVELHPFLFRGY